MKNKNKNHLIPLLALSSMLPFQSFAQTVKGGGQGIRQGGQLMLMDTVEGLAQSATCQWKPMAEFLAATPIAQDVLNKLEGIHAYAPSAFRAEAARITVCFAGELKSLEKPPIKIWVPGPYYGTYQEVTIERTPQNPVFRRVNQHLETIGFRWNQKVLVDQNKFNELSKVDQAMFLIHEISHSFLPMDPNESGGFVAQNANDPVPTVFEAADAKIFERRDRLWSFVNAIYRNYRDAVGISAADFSLAITQNGVTLPDTDAFWKKTPDAYKIALDRNSPMKERAIAISKIDWRDAVDHLVQQDTRELEFFIGTLYDPAVQILKERQYGWEAALKKQMETYGLDPMQVLRNDESLLTVAMDSQDEKEVNLLLTYPARSNDPAIRARFFHAVISNQIHFDHLEEVLKRFDPNAGELTRKIENNISIYIGEVPFFVVAIEAGNMKVAKSFVETGAVTSEVLGQGLQALIKKEDMGIARYSANKRQGERRNLMNEILAQASFKPNGDYLFLALSTQNEFAANRLLDFVTPTGRQLTELAKSSWATGQGIDVLKKALKSPGVNVNAVDEDGRRMTDYAVATRNDILFDLLIDANATEFFKTENDAEQDYTITRLIEKDAAKTLDHYLDLVSYQNELALRKILDLAQIRLKKKAAEVIQSRL